MNATTFIIIALLALLSSTATARVGNSRYHSAKCLAKKKACNSKLERYSGVCVANRYARNQSPECHQRACAWCRVPGKAELYPCTAKNVMAICKALAAGRPIKPLTPSGGSPSDPPTTSPPSTKPPTTEPPTTNPPTTEPKMEAPPDDDTAPKAGCVYSGSDRVVVELGKVPMASGWTRTSRDGMTGMVFKKDKGAGIDKQTDATTMCFKMKVSMAGDYFATAVSAAPHPTEHNDMWISSSFGFKLLRDGKFQDAKPGEFLKAYQNDGGNKLSGRISTIDHDAHVFVVPNLGPDKVLTYCMSGRSSKYEVFKLIIIKCEGRLCLTGRPSTAALISEPGSKCS